MTEPQQLGVYHFDGYRLDVVERTLWNGHQRLELNGRAFDVLAALVRRAGKLVTKDELFRVAWHGRVVEEGNLHVQISNLRKALGRKAITTVSRHGYRLEIKSNPGSSLANASALMVFDDQPPNPLTSYITRDNEESAVKARITQSRLLTLKGIGGIGKTRLAIEACRQFAFGNAELRLLFLGAAMFNQDESRIAEQRGDPHSQAFSNITTNPQQYLKFLREEPTLLLLDGCEVENAQIAFFTRYALESCPELRLVCTSRQSLGLLGEVIYEVPPLGRELSKKLLFARAPDLLSYHGPESNADDVLEAVLDRLDGIPLAIELAASRLHAIGLRDFNDHLSSLLATLTVNDISVPKRHRALRATIDWSYHRLTMSERSLLNSLCLFSSPFAIESLKFMLPETTNPERVELDALTNLIDKSMILASKGSISNQYKIPKSIREYGLEELNKSGNGVSARGDHARYMKHVLERAINHQYCSEWRDYYLPDLQGRWLDFEQALRWTLIDYPEHYCELGGEISSHLISFWVDIGRLKDALFWLKIASTQSLSPSTLAATQHALGCALSESGDFVNAIEHLNRARDGFGAIRGKEVKKAITENELGVAMFGLRRNEEAREFFQSALTTFQKFKIRFREGQATQNLAVVNFAERDIEACHLRLKVALAINKAEGNFRSTSTSLMWLAECSFLKKEYQDAFRFISEAKSLQPPIPADLTASIVFYRFSRCAAMVGEYEVAGRAAGVAVASLMELGHKRGIAECLESIAIIGIAIGDRAGAGRLLGEVRAWRHAEAIPRANVWASYFDTVEGELVGMASSGQLGPLPEMTGDVALAVDIAKQLTRAAIAAARR